MGMRNPAPGQPDRHRRDLGRGAQCLHVRRRPRRSSGPHRRHGRRARIVVDRQLPSRRARPVAARLRSKCRSSSGRGGAGAGGCVAAAADPLRPSDGRAHGRGRSHCAPASGRRSRRPASDPDRRRGGVAQRPAGRGRGAVANAADVVGAWHSAAGDAGVELCTSSVGRTTLLPPCSRSKAATARRVSTISMQRS